MDPLTIATLVETGLPIIEKLLHGGKLDNLIGTANIPIVGDLLTKLKTGSSPATSAQSALMILASQTPADPQKATQYASGVAKVLQGVGEIQAALA